MVLVGKMGCEEEGCVGVSTATRGAVVVVDLQLTKEFQAELLTRRAVSTVPPITTSFMPSTTDEPLTNGCTRERSASMVVRAGAGIYWRSSSSWREGKEREAGIAWPPEASPEEPGR